MLTELLVVGDIGTICNAMDPLPDRDRIKQCKDHVRYSNVTSSWPQARVNLGVGILGRPSETVSKC